MARYPVALFDVGETLVGPHESYGAVYHRVLADLGYRFESARLERGIRATAAEMSGLVPPGEDRFGHFAGGELEYWRRFVAGVLRRTAGRDIEAALLDRALDALGEAFGRTAAWRVYDDVVPALDALRRAGVRLGIVSNWDSRLPRLLERLGLADYFETVGVSHLERVEKPDPRLFHRVLDRLGVAARDALHVGNLAELDVAGARAAGIDGVLIDRERGAAGRPATIGDLREVVRLVEEGLS